MKKCKSHLNRAVEVLEPRRMLSETPVANDDFFATTPGQFINEGYGDPNVLPNDFGSGNVPVLVSSSSAGGTLTLQQDGAVDFHPASGFTGKFTFTYEDADFDQADYEQIEQNDQTAPFTTLANYPTSDYVLSNIATVSISVGNSPPLNVGASPAAGEQTVVAGGVDLSLVASTTTSPTPSVQWFVNVGGTSRLAAIAGATTATLDLGPATAAESGNSYEAVLTNTDGSAQTLPVSIDVTIADNDAYTATENTALTIAAPGVLNNDSGIHDVAGLLDVPTNGTVTLNASGSFVYTPNAGFTGTDSFTYQDLDLTTPIYVFNSVTSSASVSPNSEPTPAPTPPDKGKADNKPITGVKQGGTEVTVYVDGQPFNYNDVPSGVATVTLTVNPPPAIVSTQIGSGTAQRSSIKSFSVTFNEPLTFTAGAYTLLKELVNANGSINTTIAAADVTAGLSESNSGNTATFSVIAGGSLDRTAATKAGLLSNGIYQLVLHGSAITDGAALLGGGADTAVPFPSAEASGGSSTFFHVLFGDYNGDGVVNLIDYRQFGRVYLSSSSTSNYDLAFDYGGDGIINLIDYRQFATDYLKRFTY